MADAGNNDDHIVLIDKWAESLTNMLDDVPEYMCNPAHPGRISRIPNTLREADINAYEPYFVSIGPYHHGKPRVQQMEKRKLLILKFFLENIPEITLKDYLKELKSIEPATRSFYSDVEMDSEKFLQMLLLDSLYIIIFFCGRPQSQERMLLTNTITESAMDGEDMNGRRKQINEGLETGDNDENTKTADKSRDRTREQTNMPRWFWILFAHDLFLLENQLPIFVYQKIYALVYGGHETQLMGIMKEKISNMLSNYTKVGLEILTSHSEEIHHILHLCHLFFRPTLQQEYDASQLNEPSQVFRLGSTVQLYEAGVTFEVRSGLTKHCLLDIIIDSSGNITMPFLHVDDNTVSILRNLIALEQMKYPALGLSVSAYAVLLLHLVTTPEDVKLLRKKGIIQHHLSSDKEMMYLVNRLSVGLAFDYVEDQYSLKHVFRELKKYSERRVPRWRAWLQHRYFNNPWTMISLMAASLLLFLSALQTFYAVYAYYKPFYNGHT